MEDEARSCSMDYGCITPLYIYRMWGGVVPLEEIEAGLPSMTSTIVATRSKVGRSREWCHTDGTENAEKRFHKHRKRRKGLKYVDDVTCFAPSVYASELVTHL